jgi:hypothetical protein
MRENSWMRISARAIGWVVPRKAGFLPTSMDGECDPGQARLVSNNYINRHTGNLKQQFEGQISLLNTAIVCVLWNCTIFSHWGECAARIFLLTVNMLPIMKHMHARQRWKGKGAPENTSMSFYHKHKKGFPFEEGRGNLQTKRVFAEFSVVARTYLQNSGGSPSCQRI